MLEELGFEQQELDVLYHRLDKLALPTLAVTSTERNEGTSTIVSALAQCSARDGKRVLIVDLNSSSQNLTQLCQETYELNDDWRQWQAIASGINQVDILPAPNRSKLIFELTREDTLKQFLQYHGEKYEHVLIDCPSINEDEGRFIPTCNICQVAAATLIVVMSGQTIAAKVEQAISHLERDGANVLGAIMNDVEYSNLLVELIRETQRLDRYLPNLMPKIRTFLRQQAILNLQI